MSAGNKNVQCACLKGRGKLIHITAVYVLPLQLERLLQIQLIMHTVLEAPISALATICWTTNYFSQKVKCKQQAKTAANNLLCTSIIPVATIVEGPNEWVENRKHPTSNKNIKNNNKK
eukprot:11943985-Ditylum_brightwellii.AAC.1